MKKIMISLVLVIIVIASSGCQVDIQGPSMTAKVIRKGENGNNEFLSRGSGMSGGNGYHAGGGNFFSGGSGFGNWRK